MPNPNDTDPMTGERLRFAIQSLVDQGENVYPAPEYLENLLDGLHALLALLPSTGSGEGSDAPSQTVIPRGLSTAADGLEALRGLSEKSPDGPWRQVPWHIEEGPPVVRCAEGWIVATTASDDCARFIAEAVNHVRTMLAAGQDAEARGK